MKKLTRNLLVPAVLLLSGGISTMASAQDQTPATSDAAPAQQQSRAQQLMGDIAPKLAELTDGVLFGDIWERPDLSKRDRSLDGGGDRRGDHPSLILFRLAKWRVGCGCRKGSV